MQCLKCGKKTAEKQVFCEECLVIMEKHPVKPGTAIHIPQREKIDPEKRRGAQDMEDAKEGQIQRQRSIIRMLIGVLAVMSLILLLTAGMLLHMMNERNTGKTIGKNYTTVDTTNRP